MSETLGLTECDAKATPFGNPFKYYSAKRGLEVLRNLELKITPPDQLNDIFEFSPQFVCSAPRRMAKDVLRDKSTVRESYHEDKQTGHFAGTEREYRRLWKSRRTTLKNSLVAAIVEKLPTMQTRFQHLHSRYVGVLCLTSNPNSVVMWSHYAENHRGMVIEFDGSWPMFAEGKGLRIVHYLRERPQWDESAKPASDAEKVQFEGVIFHKNEEWSYERESRQLFVLRALRRKSLDDGHEGYFLTIPPKLIISVRLGMFCDPKTVAETKEILKGPPMLPASLKQAKPDNKTFSMVTVDLKV